MTQGKNVWASLELVCGSWGPNHTATGDANDLAGKVMAENMMHPDTEEGIDAFLEKRKPAWAQPGK